MKKTRMIQKHAGLFPALLAIAALVAAPCAVAQGTSFTYQGQLDDAGFAAHGAYDIRFSIWDAEVGGSQLAGPTTHVGVPVDGGLFDVELDFGASPFKGPARWLEIGVQTNGGGGFTTLSPRTEFTSAPFAITALTAAGVPVSSIGSSEVANNSLTVNDLGPNSVGASELAANSVYSVDIVDGQVGAADIGTGAVGTSEVADGSLLVNDLNLTSVDARYVEVAGDTMTGALRIDGSDLYVKDSVPFVYIDTSSDSNAGITIRDSADDHLCWIYVRGTDDALMINTSDSGGDEHLVVSSGGSVGVGRVPTTGIFEAAGNMRLYHTDGTLGHALSSGIYGGYSYMYNRNGTATITLDGDSGVGGYATIRNTNGSNRIVLDGYGSGGGGSVYVYADDGSTTVELHGESSSAGLIEVNNSVSQRRVEIDGESATAGGQVSLYNTDGVEVNRLATDTYGGEFRLYDDAGVTTVLMDSSSGGGGYSTWYQSDGQNGVFIDGHGGNGDGVIYIYDSDGSTRISLDGDSTGGGGEISVHDNDGTETVQILGAETSTTGAEIALRKADGTTTITLDADFNGDGRITTQELEITGGSDLSEQFDIDAAEPGAVVCIDAANPGKLVVSSKAYDRTVAGIVSGAGGIKPGMMMGQDGTVADGEHPVALTGRVYCKVDASQGAIEPGDLITTSNMPGHGMKVVEHAQAQGAIIGKAMTPLAEGQGLVLVLVSLQ